MALPRPGSHVAFLSQLIPCSSHETHALAFAAASTQLCRGGDLRAQTGWGLLQSREKAALGLACAGRQ